MSSGSSSEATSGSESDETLPASCIGSSSCLWMLRFLRLRNLFDFRLLELDLLLGDGSGGKLQQDENDVLAEAALQLQGGEIGFNPNIL